MSFENGCLFLLLFFSRMHIIAGLLLHQRLDFQSTPVSFSPGRVHLHDQMEKATKVWFSGFGGTSVIGVLMLEDHRGWAIWFWKEYG